MKPPRRQYGLATLGSGLPRMNLRLAQNFQCRSDCGCRASCCRHDFHTVKSRGILFVPHFALQCGVKFTRPPIFRRAIKTPQGDPEMKKLLTLVFALVLSGSLVLAQTGSSSSSQSGSGSSTTSSDTGTTTTKKGTKKGTHKRHHKKSSTAGSTSTSSTSSTTPK